MVIIILTGMALKAAATEGDKTMLSINVGSIGIGDGTCRKMGIVFHTI